MQILLNRCVKWSIFISGESCGQGRRKFFHKEIKKEATVVVFRNPLKRHLETNMSNNNMSGHFKLWCDTYYLHVEIRLLST